jgi:hypothetical protein
MKWYHYVACFFAGFFLANLVPHFIHGISGDSFPSPFANPPGKGLSSPLVNTLWALLNGVIGYLLFRAGKIKSSHWGSITVFFLGILACSLMLTLHFAEALHG